MQRHNMSYSKIWLSEIQIYPDRISSNKMSYELCIRFKMIYFTVSLLMWNKNNDIFVLTEYFRAMESAKHEDSILAVHVCWAEVNQV